MADPKPVGARAEKMLRKTERRTAPVGAADMAGAIGLDRVESPLAGGIEAVADDIELVIDATKIRETDPIIAGALRRAVSRLRSSWLSSLGRFRRSVPP